MQIAFLIDAPTLSGGINVVFEHAVRIQRRDIMTVHIIMEKALNADDLSWHPDAIELQWLTYKEAEEKLFDAVIATWWETCYKAYRIKSKSYFYFNQSVESRFYPEGDRLHKTYADSTYLLGMNIITEATWIKDFLSQTHGIPAALVLNGIRKDIYQPEGSVVCKKKKGKLRVLVEGSLEMPLKNTAKAIELCLKSKADEVWLLTNSEINEYKGVSRLFSRISIKDTASIYRSCDVLVKLSYVEGMFGPPLEMFHCGGTVIVYDVTGHDEYIKNDYNGFVVKTDNEQEVINRINCLKENTSKLDRLKQGALRTAREWYDWDAASIRFEETLLHTPAQITQYQLRQNTLLFTKWHELASIKDNFNYINDIYILRNEIATLRKTRAYRLGKMILRPWSKLRNAIFHS